MVAAHRDEQFMQFTEEPARVASLGSGFNDRANQPLLLAGFAIEP